MILVRDVVRVLREKGIRVSLQANEDTLLPGPVDWPLFNGEGLAFYVGTDSNQLCRWNNPAQGLIICDERLKEKVGQGPFLFVEKPRLSFIYAARLFIKPQAPGIHPSAIIDPGAKIGKDVSIGPLSVIGAAEIGDGTMIGALVSITDHVKIGSSVYIMNGVHLGEPSIGSVYDEVGALQLFPHFENVYVHDNVVIGVGTIVMRGALTPTILDENCHISANCSIGHNCYVGKNACLSLGVSLAGRARIGDRAYLGIGSCIKEGVQIAEDVTVGMNVTVIRSVLKKGVTLMAPVPKELGKMFLWPGL